MGACLWGDGADGDNKRTGVTLRRGPTLNFQAKEERGVCLFWRNLLINGDNRRLSESGRPKGGAILLEELNSYQLDPSPTNSLA